MKRRSNTARQKRRKYRFFLDRNLGAYDLATQLRKADVDVTVHDAIYARTERDPWVFYNCGKDGFIVITSDKTFTRSFPHMAAIQLGRTTVLYFSNNNYKSQVRGEAFLAARTAIMRALKRHQGVPFIGSIGKDGAFTILDNAPRPLRKLCDARDWESYRRVCQSEGIEAHEYEQEHNQALSGSSELSRSSSRSTENQTGTESKI